jgi:hypothetical protein
MRYRKKPAVVEAFQMTETHRWDNRDWPNWLHEAWNKDYTETGAFWCAPDGQLIVNTLNGMVTVAFDEWIVRGVEGELYPCKPEIFEQTYELAEPQEYPV